MERYGVLALILSLTTFGVLYLWDTEGGDPASTSSGAEEVAVAGRPPSRVRPPRAIPSGDAQTRRVPEASALPLSRMSADQQHLARVRSESSASREEMAANRAREYDDGRRGAARYFQERSETMEASFGGSVEGVSRSRYSDSSSERPLAAPSTDPTPAPQPMEYIVKSGDSLSMIAQEELGSVRHEGRLREVNGLKKGSDFLSVGQRLILPHIGEAAPVRGTDLAAPSGGSTTTGWVTVKVQEGQSLWKIAAQHLGRGSRYVEIMRWNGLSSEMVHPGTELRIKSDAVATLAMGGTR